MDFVVVAEVTASLVDVDEFDSGEKGAELLLDDAGDNISSGWSGKKNP